MNLSQFPRKALPYSQSSHYKYLVHSLKAIITSQAVASLISPLSIVKMMKLFSLATSLLLSVLLLSSLLQLTMALPNDVASPPPSSPPSSPPVPSFCDPKCKVRCSKSGRYQRCYHFCIICCQACKCVPSGPYANKSECPCYRDKLNTKGTSKCP